MSAGGARAVTLLLGLAGCVRTEPLEPLAAPGPVDAGPLALPLCPRADAGPVPSGAAAVRAASVIALARLKSSAEECSDLGGAHLTFNPVQVACGPAGARALGPARLGGHGFRDAHPLGSWAVVGVDPSRPVAAGGEPGWCLEGLPAADSTVVGVVWVASEAEGLAWLASLDP
jgi:hypothetical protein